MSSLKKIFISDIHLGAGGETDWFQKDKHEKNLIDFLTHITDLASITGEIKDLVLMGDIFDMWLCPMDKEPPTIQDIFRYNVDIMNTLASCVAMIPNVYFINGNHDMHVTQEDLNNFKKNGKTIKRIREYRSGRLYAIHGQRFAMFNAEDNMHDPGRGLPLGYFITRMLAGDKTYMKPSSIAKYVDDLFEAAFTTQTISESFIKALMEHTKKKPTDTFFMRGGKEITIADVQKKYKYLFDRWVEKKGYWYALKSIKADVGSLNYFADRECKKREYNSVIFGHTHESEYYKDSFRIYANTGNWCCDKPTYVVVDKDNGKTKVSLYQFYNNKSKLLKEGEI